MNLHSKCLTTTSNTKSSDVMKSNSTSKYGNFFFFKKRWKLSQNWDICTVTYPKKERKNILMKVKNVIGGALFLQTQTET